MSTPEARLNELAAHVLMAETRHATWVDSYRSYLRQYSKRVRETPRSITDANGHEMNLAFGEVETFVGRVTGYVPDVSVTPRKKESIFQAMIAEAVVDYWFESLRVDREWVRAVRNCGISGIGWLKTGWNKQGRTPDRVLKVSKDEFKQMTDLRDEIANAIGGAPTDEQIYNYLQKSLSKVRIGTPTCYSVSPVEVLFDPFCTSLVSGRPRWVMHRYWRSLRDVQTDKMLSTRRNKVQGQGFGATSNMTLWSDQTAGDTNDPMVRVLFNELYDIETQSLIIYVDDITSPLFDDEIPFATGYPLTPIVGWEVDGSPYPMGVIELVAEQVKGINEQRSVTAAIRRGQIPKNLITNKLIGSGKDVQEVLRSNIPNDTAVVNLNEPINQHIHRIEGNQIQQDWYAVDGQLRNDAEWVLGFNDVARGSFAPGTHRSAAEITSAMQAGGDRVGAIVNEIRSSLVTVARKMIGHARQYMASQDVVRLSGFASLLADAQQKAVLQSSVNGGMMPQASPEEVLRAMMESGGFLTPSGDMMFPFDGTTVDGEFDFTVSIGPKMSDDGPTRAQNALQMLQVLAPFPEVNKAALVKFALEQGWDIKDASQFISMQQPPMMDPNNPDSAQQDMPGMASVAGSPVSPPGASFAPGLTQQ